MFKTIEECRLELVAHTFLLSDGDCDNDAYHPMTDNYLVTSDFMPCSAARVSFGNEDKTGSDAEKDKKLMKYLAEHKHMTPFEYQHATFLIEVPLFIRSQIHRHRAFSYNEISRRYTDESLEFWTPTTWRGQSKSNRQASSSEEITQLIHPEDGIGAEDLWGSHDNNHHPSLHYQYQCQCAKDFYNELLLAGVCREQARAVLPQSLLTKFYMGGNLRSWAHFIELRRDEHAQLEIQIVANRVAEKLRELWPNSCEALGI